MSFLDLDFSSALSALIRFLAFGFFIDSSSTVSSSAVSSSEDSLLSSESDWSSLPRDFLSLSFFFANFLGFSHNSKIYFLLSELSTYFWDYAQEEIFWCFTNLHLLWKLIVIDDFLTEFWLIIILWILIDMTIILRLWYEMLSSRNKKD